MLAPYQVLEATDQVAAMIHITILRDRIQEVMGDAIGEVIQVAVTQGIGPTGPVFAHHYDMQPGIFNFDVGVPVSSAVVPTGRVTAGTLPAAKVARTVYTGPYEGLGDAWGEFIALVEADGHQPIGDLWECYLTDPSAESDPSAYRTELNYPIR